MVALMGPDVTEQEPALQRPDTRDDCVFKTLCSERSVRTGSTESQSTYKRRLYDTMHYMCRAATERKEFTATNSLAYSMEKSEGNTCSWGH